MGAKVEAEGYSSGHYNLQARANGWRSSYSEERTSNGEFFNGFMATGSAGHSSDYDKEMFKRTMLAHEAAFRQQVYELHRVYRIQRDLAEQYQNKEMHACPRLEYASQVPLHGAKTIAAAATVNNEKSQSLKFLREGSVQSSPNGFPSSDAALHTKQGKHASNISYLAPRYSDTDPRKTFNVADERPANINQFIYQCPNSSTGWFSRSPLEASALNNFSGHVHRSSLKTIVSPIPSPHIGHPSVAARVGSCIVDPRSYNSNANVHSFPNFNGSSMVNSYICLDAVNQSIRTLPPNHKTINNSEGSYSGFPLDSLSATQRRHQVAISSDFEQNNRLKFEHSARHFHEDPDFVNGKGRNNFNLNEALSDGQEDVLVEQGGVCVGSLQHIEGDGSVSGVSWLSKKASFADSTRMEEPRKVLEHSNEIAMEMKINKDRSGAALAHCNLPDSALTSVGCEAKKDKTQEIAACLRPSCQKLVPRDGQAAEGIINKSGAAILNFFDLNDDAPNEDNSESSIGAHEFHVTSVQNNHDKRNFVIDLEVPACEDAADIAAAEDILALSMDVPTTDTPDNMLEWFAELAVSRVDGDARQVEIQGCIGNCSDDDLDSFESLTLKLEETKFVEFCSWPLAPAVTSDEQTVSPVSLLTKPKRGQQRKRRQKRDFQKDILPSMSSLCRPEIIEDIQLLEGLVQTNGGSWESSFTRRQRTRGKKPKKRRPDPVEEDVEISLPAKPDGAGLEADDRSMIGWGRTTRRCRRPRCPSGITVAAAS